jgi:hypothetical protein
MVQNVVAGFVLLALIVIGLISFAQEHHECLRGHIVKTLQPCGADGPSV